ncbi:hypothetical protein O6H91_19G023600 [Diphasiastrum complanatum]|uniref:Uncharacterized protein n=1 Tax=Diphasiastrum complanatum TaxID=34168 RepID=A0ACC2AU78_DIPCM|nr:hypothetical protein O6H91_19G023600 [Diphasiastrum complanatum]
MKLREAEALAHENGSRPKEANNKQREARTVEQRAGSLEKKRDLPDHANTHLGWVWRLLDQVLFKPFCCCLPIFNRSDPQCLSGKAPSSAPSKDATQNSALPKSSGMSDFVSTLQVRSVRRGPPIKSGPQPQPH